MEGIGREGLPGFRSSLNTGYVIIPDNFKGSDNRNSFVINCLRKERLSIIIENGGGVKHNCYVTREVLQDIVFPDVTVNEDLDKKDEVSRLGSQVVFVSEPYLDQPVIIGIVSKLDETSLFQENEYKIIRSKNGSTALLNINGNTGEISIATFGNKQSGNMNITISNSTQDAALNLTVKGKVNIASTSDFSLISNGFINLKSDSGISAQTKEDIVLNPDKTLKVGTGKEPVLLGNTTYTALNTEAKAVTGIINAIKNIIALPVTAGSPDATWGTLITAINAIINRGDYSKIKSEKSFTD